MTYLTHILDKYFPVLLCNLLTHHMTIVPYWTKHNKGCRWICLCSSRVYGTVGVGSFWEGAFYPIRVYLNSTLWKTFILILLIINIGVN